MCTMHDTLRRIEDVSHENRTREKDPKKEGDGVWAIPSPKIEREWEKRINL